MLASRGGGRVVTVKFLAFTTDETTPVLLRPENLNEEQSADSLPSGLNNVFARSVTAISPRRTFSAA